MFGRKHHGDASLPRLSASATVVSVTSVAGVTDLGMALFDVTVDVTPAVGDPFRQTTRQPAMADQHPQAGDKLTVSYDPEIHRVTLELDDDPRYRPQDPGGGRSVQPTVRGQPR